MLSNVLYPNFRSAFPAHRFSPGTMVQLTGWPEHNWAEVVEPAGCDNRFKMVRYSSCGTERFIDRILPALVARVCEKNEIPLDHLISGSIDMAQGKLGQVSMRWTSCSAQQRIFG